MIEFSWDDGAYEDLRLLNILSKFDGFDHTFYIPAKNIERPVICNQDIITISQFATIGSHTYNHIFLDTIHVDNVECEVASGRKFLEDLLGCEVDKFCFPGGKYNRHIVKKIKNTVGLARTTNLMSCSSSNGDFIRNTTLQLVYRDRISLVKHILAFAPLRLKMQILDKIRHTYRIVDLLRIYVEFYRKHDCKKDINIHIWGHSWEIEKHQLWGELEDILRYLQSVR